MLIGLLYIGNLIMTLPFASTVMKRLRLRKLSAQLVSHTRVDGLTTAGGTLNSKPSSMHLF